MTIRMTHDPKDLGTPPAAVICEFCGVDTHAVVQVRGGGGLACYVDHQCPSKDEWVGVVTNGSRLPGWHPLHQCGMFCDGQDGASSQCAESKRHGPPSIVETIGEIKT